MENIKEVRFGSEARAEILKGVDTVANAVSSTMGAKGRNVLYETLGGLPKITKDGVTVAKNIFLEEPLQSLGAELLKESANNSVNECGDGTTTNIVLSREIMNLANAELEKGAHPIFLKKGIEDAVKHTLEHIKSKRVKVKQSDYENVATISANNDRDLGKVIADAFKLAGKNGVVTYEKSLDETTTVEKSDGLKIERGLYNSYMATNKKTKKMELENPFIFVCEKKIEDFSQIRPLAEKSSKENVWVLIIGEMDKKVTDLLSLNIVKGNLKTRYIEAPSFGSKRKDLMEDIALATGANLIRNEGADNIASLCLGALGTAKGFVSGDKESFLDIDKSKHQEAINGRISELKEYSKTLTKSIAKDFIEERIAKLSCSIANIKVGANSDVELDEKIDRVDDAVNATKSAIEEGILVGGGLALFNASYHITRESKNHKDYNSGYAVVVEALRKPLRQILENAGYSYEKFLEHKETSNDEQIGYDVKKERYVNFFKQGIVDPHKVTRCALSYASSVAQTFILTNATINIKRAK
jgi:chaperonin GroEL